MTNALAVLVAIAVLAAQSEFLLYIMAKSFFPAGSRGLRAELWWTTAHLAGPIFLLSYLANIVSGDFTPWFDSIVWPLNALVWWYSVVKDDDKDDRWKKRRKRAVAKVKEVAGKLVVVPLPNPA